MRVRLLSDADIPEALKLSSEAGWNQTAQDWRAILAAGQGTCFGIEHEGQLASTVTLICYGTRLAWIGMVLTRADLCGRGFARTLLERVLTEADARRIETVKLDATAQGQPIYRKLGFQVEQDVQRWSGYGLAPPPTGHPGPLPLDMDLSAFGADRSELLLQLGHLHASPAGYVLARPGRCAGYLGPCIAQTPDAASQLIQTALHRHHGPWFWDLLPANQPAAELATKLGFQISRRVVRMYRGKALRGDESTVYAIAGFEFG